MKSSFMLSLFVSTDLKGNYTILVFLLSPAGLLIFFKLIYNNIYTYILQQNEVFNSSANKQSLY